MLPANPGTTDLRAVRFTDDVLILGHGLAGAVLAETLRHRGLRVHVFDRHRPGKASMVAAGLVNPMVLKRDVPSWRASELLPLAHRSYRDYEQRLEASFWHPIELVKCFATEHDAERWQQVMCDPGTASFIDRRAQPSVDHALVHAPHGHGTVHGAAWLDVPAFLRAQRKVLLREDALTEADISAADIVFEASGSRVAGRAAPWLVRCTGAFDALPGLVPVKGEGLTLRLAGLPRDRALHRGVFATPVQDGLHRVGATFAWQHVWDGPTEQARHWLLQQLAKLTPQAPEVVDQWCGVRPAALDRRPILGLIGRRQAVFNGLGARGVLLAPWCAAHLSDHLLDGKPLDHEVDAARFFR